MKITELESIYQGEWTVESINCAHDHLHDATSLVEHCGVRVELNVREYLGEATYRELTTLIDPNFLNQKVRASELVRVEFAGFEGNTMQFLVPSSEYDKNHIKYANLVQFSDWEQVAQMPDLNAHDKAMLLLWQGQVKLHCTCPSQIYWGYQYILTVLDSSIYPEERKPVIRNPQDRGICCKHLNRTLQVLPFQSGRIANELKKQFGL